MKLLLVSPPTDSAIKRVVGTTGPPLSLTYLASMIRAEHDVKIVDSVAENISFEDLRQKIKNFDSELFGITAITSMMPDAYETARISKNLNKNIKTVIGGPHVTFLPDKTLNECPYIDYVVRGEGEHTLRNWSKPLKEEKVLNVVI